MMRLPLAVLIGCALATSTTAAQTPPPAAKADSPAAVLNSILSDAERVFVDVAEAMPATKFEFAPTTGDFTDARSFAGTIKHVIWANYYLAAKISGLTQSVDKAAIESMTDRGRILAQLHDSFVAAHRAIDSLSPDNMLEGGQGRAARLGGAAFLTAHTMAHCGELVEYLRMNGIVPPKSWS
jgi:DinB superfamily